MNQFISLPSSVHFPSLRESVPVLDGLFYHMQCLFWAAVLLGASNEGGNTYREAHGGHDKWWGASPQEESLGDWPENCSQFSPQNCANEPFTENMWVWVDKKTATPFNRWPAQSLQQAHAKTKLLAMVGTHGGNNLVVVSSTSSWHHATKTIICCPFQPCCLLSMWHFKRIARMFLVW